MSGGGGYTPNKRCRPEAPLTSLTKLTPVKNDENRKGEGERRNKTRFKKKKIIRNSSRGMVLEAGTRLNGMYSNKAVAEQNKCYG